MGLQFVGNRGSPVYFQQGRDVVLPVYLLGHRLETARDDLPSCGPMSKDSPYARGFARRARHSNRNTLLWFGGHPGGQRTDTDRYRLWESARALPGFELINT